MFPLRKNSFRIHACNFKPKQSWKPMFCVRFIIVDEKGAFSHKKVGGPRHYHDYSTLACDSLVNVAVVYQFTLCISVDSLHGNEMCKTPEITM